MEHKPDCHISSAFALYYSPILPQKLCRFPVLCRVTSPKRWSYESYGPAFLTQQILTVCGEYIVFTCFYSPLNSLLARFAEGFKLKCLVPSHLRVHSPLGKWTKSIPILQSYHCWSNPHHILKSNQVPNPVAQFHHLPPWSFQFGLIISSLWARYGSFLSN